MKKYYKTHLIKNFIKKNKWSITRFCKECRIGLDVYKKIIAQKLNFGITALFRVARVIGVQVCELCY